MPIKIYVRGVPEEELAWLCGDDWDLPTQIDVIGEWLQKNGGKIEAGDYIADVGFRVRSDAGGGGSVLTPEMMNALAHLGITLQLSEYS